jgi:hypothetical protein
MSKLAKQMAYGDKAAKVCDKSSKGSHTPQEFKSGGAVKMKTGGSCGGMKGKK